MSAKSTGRGWAYLGAALGAGVSIAANVAHSFVPPGADELARLGVTAAEYRPHGGAVGLAVFWPVALLVGIEVVARTPWQTSIGESFWETVARLGLVPVAAVAALVSYLHLSGLLAFYGEGEVTSVVGPAAIDGLMILCSGALIATAGRRPAAAEPVAAEDDEPAEEVSPPADPWPAYSVPAVSPVAVSPVASEEVSPPAEVSPVAPVSPVAVAARVSPPPGVAVSLPAVDVPLPFETSERLATAAGITDSSPVSLAGDAQEVEPDSRGPVGATSVDLPADPVEWILAERANGREHSGAEVGRAYGRNARYGQRQVRRADERARTEGRTLRAIK